MTHLPHSPALPDEGRVAWVDTAKGICIVLVVMMHSTLGVGEAMGGEGFMHWLVAFSKPFRMPDFFLVSGLFLARVVDRDWRIYADRRVVHFAYFYLLWLVIQSALKYGQVSGGTPSGFVQHIAFSLVEPYSTLWFIYLLAVLSVTAKLLRNVPAPVILLGAAALQIAHVETGWTLVDEFCARAVFFMAGWLLAPRIFAIAERVAAHRPAALAGIAVWAGVNGALAFTPSTVPGYPTLASLPFVALALGFAGALAIVAAATLLTRAGWGEPLRYCGRHSIAIYLAFFLPMAASRAALMKLGLTDIGLAAAIVTMCAVVVPLILERAVRHTPLNFLFHRPDAFHIAPRRTAPRLQPAE